MKGNVKSGAIKPLQKVTLDDVLNTRRSLCDEASTVIYLPEDCNQFVVLKDPVHPSARFVMNREPDLIHEIIMFGLAFRLAAAQGA